MGRAMFDKMNNPYGKTIGVSLLLHGILFSLVMWLGQAASDAQKADTAPALIEIIPSKVLSMSGMSGMEPGTGAASIQAGAPPAKEAAAPEPPRPTVAEHVPASEESSLLQAGITEAPLPSVLQGNSDEPALIQSTVPETEADKNAIGGAGSGLGREGEGYGGGGGGKGGTAAAVIRGRAPRYPAAARKAGWEGIVLVRVLVDIHGSAARISVRESSGYELLDATVVQSVKKWRFFPATQGGKPVASFHDVRVRFRLTDPPLALLNL